MEKIWYIYLEGKKEGPYDIPDLRNHPKVTPDTLAWKMGYKEWVPIRKIFELQDVFKDEEQEKNPDNPDNPEQDKLPKSLKPQTVDDEAVALRYEPPGSYFWILIAILIIFYTFYLIFEGQR